MRKEGLVHLHNLLSEIKDEVINREEDVSEEDFQNYNKLDIRPVEVHKGKKAHREAIMVLGEELVENMGKKVDEDVKERVRDIKSRVK